MKILVTGTTGYIAKRLIAKLLEADYNLLCCVRDINRIPKNLKNKPQIKFIEIDFLNSKNKILPKTIDVAYYLIHSMSTSSSKFTELEYTCALNFKKLIQYTNCKQVIYLGGIVNDQSLSKHLQSRFKVEQTLQSSQYALTTFRAGIIVGSGSASFEIIRDLVEKLPVMIAPKWLHTKTQPIAIRDVLSYLTNAVLNKEVFNKSYDIVGPEILTYKQMLLEFAEIRKLKRFIITIPVLTPKLSSYWLYFVTSTSFKLARSLVDSMKVEVIGKPSNINKIIQIKPIPYKEAVEKAFEIIAQNAIISSWKDAMISGIFNTKYAEHINLPHYGCLKDIRSKKIIDEKFTLERIWSIGGETGWYKFNFLWKIRGSIDKLFGGVGLRRGRRHKTRLTTGDAIDFWRVLLADKEEKRLVLYAEMKLPGEAWLEFRIVKGILYQRAIFRPKGMFGRLYWYAVLPLHTFIFKGMINVLIEK